MTDLTNYVRRDGKEILFRHEQPYGNWLIVSRDDNGDAFEYEVFPTGHSTANNTPCPSDLIPPPEYGYLAFNPAGEMFQYYPSSDPKQTTWNGLPIYRYIKGQHPPVLEEWEG